MPEETERARPRNKWAEVARIAAGTLVSVLCLWLAFRGVNWRGVGSVLLQANLWLLGLALGSVLLTTLARAARWRALLAPERAGLGLGRLFRILLIGQAINALIPVRVGELARAVLVGEAERVSKAYAFWTTVVEKVLDALTLLLFLGAISLILPLPEWLRGAGWTLSLGVVMVLLLMALAVVSSSVVMGRLERFSREHAWAIKLPLARLLAVVTESLRFMSGAHVFSRLSAWSVGVFLISAATNWLTALALGLSLPASASLLLLSVLQISAVVPIPTSPGRVGLFHYLCVITLAIYGVERDVALSYALVLHGLTYLPMAVGGPVCLWLENYDLRRLSNLWVI